MESTRLCFRRRPESHFRAILPRLSVTAAWLVVAVCWLSAAPLPASEQQTRLERWRAEVREIDADARAGEKRSTRRAGRAAERLWIEVRQRGWREPALKGVLAEIATQLAVAQLNQGKDQDRAIWTFHGALLLDSSVAERDWAPYGRAGRILAEIELRVLHASPTGQRVLKRPFPRGGRFERPAAGEPKDVEVPMNRVARHEPRIIRPTIEVVLRKDGSVSHPAIALGHSAKPTVTLAVLDMIWETQPYEPARLDGEPVDIIYEVSIEEFLFDRWEDMVVYD